MSKLKYLFLALVLLVSAFTHFYRINHTLIFHNDEARDVLIVKKMIDSRKPILLGPQTSVGNMYLGPLYYYLMLPALLMTGLDPVGPAYMVALFGVITSGILFYLGYKKSGILAGTVASLFYALSPVMLHYSRSSWNPNLVPFFAVLLILAWEWKSTWSWLLLGVCAGAIFQLHYVALAFVALIAFAKLSRRPSPVQVTLAILGFILISAPFWAFEIRHGFVNSYAFLIFLKEGSQNADINSSYLSRLLDNFQAIIQGIVGSSSISLTPVANSLLVISGGLLFVILPFLTHGLILWYLLIGSCLIVSILKEPLNIHYVSYLFPVVALSFGLLASSSHRFIKYSTVILLLALTWHNLPTLVYNLRIIDTVAVKRARAVAEYIVSEARGESYNVVSTPGTYATPIEYFLALSSNPPTTAYESLIFDICEGGPCPPSDETSILFYGSGPTHPSISDYLGHPAVNEFNARREIQKNVEVSYGIWVATMKIKD